MAVSSSIVFVLHQVETIVSRSSQDQGLTGSSSNKTTPYFLSLYEENRHCSKGAYFKIRLTIDRLPPPPQHLKTQCDAD